jgi:hypothetical protein
MSKRTNNPTRVFTMSFMLFVAIALVASERLVSRAQDAPQDATNTNGSMQTNAMQNANRGRGGRRPTGRRNTPRAANSNMNADNTNMSGNMNSDMTGDAAGMQDANSNMNANMNANANMDSTDTNNNMDASMGTNNNMDSDMTAPTMTAPAEMAAPVQSDDTSADTSGEQTDLSGTYTGTINFAEASLTGEATLTITGNEFAITTPTGSQSGRITAITTRGYTGVAMRFNDLTAPGGTPLTVSARARRTGDRLTLSKIPGGQDISFTSGGGSGGTRPRARRGARRRR